MRVRPDLESKKSCNEIILLEGRMREGKHPYTFFVDVQKDLTQFGMMADGLHYGNLVLGVGCGELLRKNMTLYVHRVLFNWRKKSLISM